MNRASTLSLLVLLAAVAVACQTTQGTQGTSAGSQEVMRVNNRPVYAQELVKSPLLRTSLRNYIDPRIFKSWAEYVGLDWKKIYTKSLQRKFLWASRSRKRWKPTKKRRRRRTATRPASR